MAKLLEVGVLVPDVIPENSPVEVVYEAAYWAQARAAGGMVEGKTGSATGGFRPLLAKGGGPLLVYGGELNDPVPPMVTIRVKPRGAGVKGQDWGRSGHPRDTGDGKWDGSQIGEGAAGDRIVTEAQALRVQDITAQFDQAQLDLSAERAAVEQALADNAQTTDAVLAAANSKPYATRTDFPAPTNGLAATAMDTGAVYRANGTDWLLVGYAPTKNQLDATQTQLQTTTQATLTALQTGTFDAGAATRLLTSDGVFDVLPNASAPAADGVFTYQLAGGKRAVFSPYSAGFLPLRPLGGGQDDYARLQAAINRAVTLGIELRLMPNGANGVFLTSQELANNGRLYMSAAGNGFFPTVSIKATAAIRSVFRGQGDFNAIRGIAFDADKKASYAMLEDSFRHSNVKECGFKNAVLDNTHRVQARTSDGAQANNDGNKYHDCTWLNAGRVFGTAAMLARAEYNDPHSLANQKVTVAGTISVTAGSKTVTGAGTTFLATGARPGDTVRLGDGWLDAQKPVLLEIASVDSDTQITVHNDPGVTLAAQDYAIHVGDNFHEQNSVDNNTAIFFGGLSRGAAGSGLLWAGAFGNTGFGLVSDFNMGWGFKLGRRFSATPHMTPTLYFPYVEGNFFGRFENARSTNLRIIGINDGTGAADGPLMRTDEQMRPDVTRNAWGAIGYGFGGDNIRKWPDSNDLTGSGWTMPIARVSESTALNTGNTPANYPTGLSFHHINGATQGPNGIVDGVVQTFVHPYYRTDGYGFSGQIFYARNGRGIYGRTGTTDTPSKWGGNGFARLDNPAFTAASATIPAVAAGATVYVDLTVSGLPAGAVVIPDNAQFHDDLWVKAKTTGAGTLRLFVTNRGAATVTPTAAAYVFRTIG